MVTPEEFKAMRDAVPVSVQGELLMLMTSDPDASIQRMVEIAGEKGMMVTADEVKGFVKQMNKDDEFDDLKLDIVALAAIVGGRIYQRPCCQEEVHDEPWGRCSGMRPMRKWLFGVSPKSA